MGPLLIAGLLLVGRVTAPGSDSLLGEAEHLFLNRHLASGRADSALALASRPATGKAGLALRARMYCQLGEEAPDRETQVRLCRRARAAADSLLELDENSAAGHLWRASARGRLAALQGPLRAAAAVAEIRRGLERAVELAPRDALARYALGRLMTELPGMLGGSRARAEAELRAALEADPGLTIARLELARVLAATDRLPGARCQLDTLLAETRPSHPAEFFRHDRPAALELRARLENR